jgi:anti-sigma B factor antagonist
VARLGHTDTCLNERAIVGLEISTRESSGVTIVELDGKATIGADNDLLNGRLRKLVAGGARNLLLNLVGLTQVDSTGIGTIAGAFVSVSRQGGTLKLLRPRGRVRAALNVLKWFDYIATFEDEAQALASFHLEAHSAGT